MLGKIQIFKQMPMIAVRSFSSTIQEKSHLGKKSSSALDQTHSESQHHQYLKSKDPEIYNLINSEKKRQQETITLIASENFCSSAVNIAVGSCLTNKYSEGYVGGRFYTGCQNVDEIEKI